MCEAHYAKANDCNRVRAAESEFGPHVLPARADRLEIFTPSRKACQLPSDWGLGLKG